MSAYDEYAEALRVQLAWKEIEAKVHDAILLTESTFWKPDEMYDVSRSLQGVLRNVDDRVFLKKQVMENEGVGARSVL